METLRAKVKIIDEKYFIEIDLTEEKISIPMSDDKPNDVKSAFNKLIIKLKTGEYKVELEDIGEDLFSQVAKEYVTQLNREIKCVYSEMKEYGLVES